MPRLELAPRLTIHYLDENPSGQPVVLLLHGLGSNSSSWVLQTGPLIASGYRILAPDSRGFGQSTYPGRISIQLMAADAAALLQSLKASSAIAVGISMGGVIAQQLALDHPGLISKLVLVNTFSCLRPRRLSEFSYFALRFLLVHTLGLQPQARAVARRIFPHPGQESLRQVLYSQITQANLHAYRGAMRTLARFDSRTRLAGLRIPTLVVTGEQDTTVHPDVQLALAQAIPGARQIIIPGAGHAASVDKPDEFNKLLLEFIAN